MARMGVTADGATGVSDYARSLFSSRVGPEQEGYREWLDGCQRVYLDVGSNVGIQVRKLFEPELYPDADVLPVFDSRFGPPEERKRDPGLCAVGFEPNPRNEARLLELQAAYRKQGWRVKFFTQTAVSVQDGTADFYADQAPPEYNEPGASLLPWRQSEDKTTVNTMDLAKYINEHVGRRRVDPTQPTKVVMKLDIEGMEHELFPALIVSGAVCNHVDSIFHETHGWGETTYGNVKDTAFHNFFYAYIQEHPQQCRLTMEYIDDETYDTSTFDLPS